MGSVLIVSGSGDAHALHMQKVLDSKKITNFLFLTNKYPYLAHINFDFQEGCTIFCNGNSVEITSDWSIWNRRLFSPEFPEGFPKNLEAMVTEEAKATIQGLLVTHRGLVVNNPANNYRASNKMHQLRLAEEIGLRIPDTIITNVPKRAVNFYEEHNRDIIFKMQKLPIVEVYGKYKTIMTTKVKSEDLIFIERIRNNPCCFQERIEKEYEIRLTVIGNQLFPIAIYSQNSEYSKDDFRRYDFENVKYKLVEMPKDLGEKILLLTREYGLHYATIDLILTPKGDYIFLEVNPNGQYLWTEEMSGISITEAFADYLSGDGVRKF